MLMELWFVPDSWLCFCNSLQFLTALEGQCKILFASPDVTQVKPHGKSTTYRDQHYYRGYHPNLAASPLGQDR